MVNVKELIREKNAMKEQFPSAGQRNKDMKKIKTTQNLEEKKEEMTMPVVKREEEMTMTSSVKRLIREKEAMREAEQSVKDSKEERREKVNKRKVERLLQPSGDQDKDMNKVPKAEGDTTATINMKQLIREREEREAVREKLLSAEKNEMKNKTKTHTKIIKIGNIKDMTTENKVVKIEGELTLTFNIKQLIRDKEAMIMNNEVNTTGDTVQRIKHKRTMLRNKLESERLQFVHVKDDMNKQRTMEKKEEMTTTANVKQLVRRKSMTEELPSADLKTMESNVQTIQETIKYNVKQLIREREAMEDERTDNKEEWREERLLKRIERREVRLQRITVEQNKDMDKLKKTETMEEDMKTIVNVKQRIREKEPLTDRLLSPKQDMSEDIKKERREKKRLQWVPAEQNSDMNKTKSTTECRLLRMEEEMTEMSNVKQLVRQREAKRLAAAQHKQRMKNETSTTDRNVPRLEEKVKDIMEKREKRNLQLIPAELETKMGTTGNVLKTESTVATLQLTGEKEATAEQLLSAQQENGYVQSETKTTEDDSVQMEDKMKHIKEERKEDSEKLEERFDLISVERHKDMKTTETIEEEVTIMVNVIREEETKTEHLLTAEQNNGIENEIKTTENDSGVKTEERFKDTKEQQREDGDTQEEERLQLIPDLNKMTTTQNKLPKMEEEMTTMVYVKKTTSEMESTTLPSSAEQENEDVQNVQNEMKTTEDDSVKMEEKIKDLKEERREEAEELETEDDSVKMEEKIEDLKEERREEAEELEETFHLIRAEQKNGMDNMEKTENMYPNREEDMKTIVNVVQPIKEKEALTEQLISVEQTIDMKVLKTTDNNVLRMEAHTEDMNKDRSEERNTWEETLELVSSVIKMEEEIEVKDTLIEQPIEEMETVTKQPIEQPTLTELIKAMDTLIKQPTGEMEKLTEQPIGEMEKLTEQPIGEMETLTEQLHSAEQNNKDMKDQMKTTEDKLLAMEGNIADIKEERTQELNKQEDEEIADIKEDQREEEDKWQEESLKLISSAEQNNYISTMETPEDNVLHMSTMETPEDNVLHMSTMETPEDNILHMSTMETPEDNVLHMSTMETPVDDILHMSTMETPEDNVLHMSTMETPEDNVLHMSTMETPEDNILHMSTMETPEDNVLHMSTMETPVDDILHMSTMETPEDNVLHMSTMETPEDNVLHMSTMETPVDDVLHMSTMETPEDNVLHMSTMETPEDNVLHMSTMKTLEDFVRHMMKTPEDDDLKWQENTTTMKIEEKFEDIKEESSDENLKELDMEQEMEQEMRAMVNVEKLIREGEKMTTRLLYAERKINDLKDLKRTENNVPKAEDNIEDIQKEMREMGNQWQERLELLSAEHNNYMNKIKTTEQEVLKMQKEMTTIVNLAQRIREQEARAEQWLSAKENVKGLKNHMKEAEDGVLTEEKILDIKEERTEEVSLQRQVIREKEETKENQVLEREETPTMVDVIRLITDDEAVTEQLLPAEESLQHQMVREKESVLLTEEKIKDIEEERTEEERTEEVSLLHKVIREKEERTGSRQLEKSKQPEKEQTSVIKIEEDIAEKKTLIVQPIEEIVTLTEQPIKEMETLVKQPIEEEKEEGTESKQLEKEQTSVMVNRLDVPHTNDVHPNAGGPPDAGETGGDRGGGVDAATGGSVTELVNVVQLITDDKAMTDQLLSAKQEEESIQHQVSRENISALTEENIKDIQEERTDEERTEEDSHQQRTESKQLEKEQTSMEGNKWEMTLELVSSVIKMEEEIEEKKTLSEQPIEEMGSLMKQPLEEEKEETKEIQVLEKGEISMMVNMVRLITDNEAMTEQSLLGKQEGKLISAEQTDDMNDIKTAEEHTLLNIKEDLREATDLDENWTTQFCQLTLDPNTVNDNLSLSENDRRLTNVRDEQPYPYHPERFDSASQVLCRQGLTGCCYWEVEWSEQASIAVAYRGITRTGHNDDCLLGYNDMSWSLDCYEVRKNSYEGLQGNRYIVRHNGNTTIVPDGIMVSNRVGVYLDWSAGILSFYSVSSETRTHLYTFQTTFTEPLYCAFWCWMLDASVTLCQIEQ